MIADVEEKMRKHGATVYAAFDYTAENADELTFGVGVKLTVMQCSDDIETEWWWCQLGECAGYVPQNLLAVSSRFFYYPVTLLILSDVIMYNCVTLLVPIVLAYFIELVIALKIKCNIFLFVEVNFSTSVFNINKSI